MSRDLLDDEYYVSHGEKIPVKWTAPEVGYIRAVATGPVSPVSIGPLFRCKIMNIQ